MIDNLHWKYLHY